MQLADCGLFESQPMVAQDIFNCAREISASDDATHIRKELSVEVRGSRTNGVLPTSIRLHLPSQATVSDVKAKLEGCAQAPHSVKATQLKLVHAGRAVANDETLSLIAAEDSPAGEVTLHAVLLGPGERNAAPTSVKVGSVSVSPAGPSPLSSPRHCSSQSSFASSPQSFSYSASPVRSNSPQWVESLRKQVEDGMRKAFFDLIEKSLSEEQPDAEWVARLYAEMRDKLCALTPRRPDLHKQIHDALDVDLFETMVRHKAFDPVDLSKLVGFVFGRLQDLCSPSRDAEVQKRREELQALMEQPGVTFAKFAVLFLKHFHVTIEDIESDVAEFKKMMSNPMPTPASSCVVGGAAVPSSPSSQCDFHSAAGSVQDLLAKLRQMGVSEDVLSSSGEKKELEALLQQATCRATGTVSGGVLHPSLIKKQPDAHIISSEQDSSATPSVFPRDVEAAVGAACKRLMPVNFKIMQRGAIAPLDKFMMLPLDTKVVTVRARVACACGIERAAGGIKLVVAGRVLADDEQLDALYLEEGLQIYAVLPKLDL